VSCCTCLPSCSAAIAMAVTMALKSASSWQGRSD
jgi:hypothetical protein